MTQTYIILIFVFAIVIYVFWKLNPKAFKRIGNPFPLKEVFPKKSEINGFLISITLIALVLFSITTEQVLGGLKIRVMPETHVSANTVKEFADVKIQRESFLISKEQTAYSTFIGLLIFDGRSFLVALTLLIICIVCTIGFWDLDFNDPFKKVISKPVYTIGYIIIIYAILSIVGLVLADKYVLSKTNHEYKVMGRLPFTDLFKIWLGGIIFRAAQIIKTAEKIKAEQDLTV
jgi:hypothetical protein